MKNVVKTTHSAQVVGVETLCVKINSAPFDACYRTAIGLVMVPTMSRLGSDNPSAWRVLLSLLSILLLMRVVPALLRRFVPCSDEVRAMWCGQRRLAKLYDSYQWRKLLWIGLGLVLHAVFSDRVVPADVEVSAVCLLGGALGWARWRIVMP